MQGEPKTSGKLGKALVFFALSALPMTGLVMWIGLSGKGRDATAELYWLGDLPKAPVGAPAPFDRLGIGASLEEAQALLPILFTTDEAADSATRRDVVAFRGRALTRRIQQVPEGGLRFDFASGTQTVQVHLRGTPLRVERIDGISARPWAVPEAWGAPDEAAPALRVWTSSAARFSLSDKNEFELRGNDATAP